MQKLINKFMAQVLKVLARLAKTSPIEYLVEIAFRDDLPQEEFNRMADKLDLN